MSVVSDRLAEAGFVLPPAPKALGSYVPAVRAGTLVFTSGQLPLRDGALLTSGHVGGEVSADVARECAAQCALNALAAASTVCDLDRVTAVVKVTGYVASAAGFTGQPSVVDGASQVVLTAFGDPGKHARAAVGVAELPLSAPVEVELVLAIDEQLEVAEPEAGKARIPRNVTVLGIVSLLTDASSEMIYPVLPLFLANVLHAPVTAIGLIESIAEATASLTKVFSGWLSDKLGRRKTLVATGYTMSNVMKPLLALSAGWPSVLLLRFADRLGKGVRTAPRDALIADSGTAATRGRDFGFHRALDTLGAAIGPLIAWIVLSAAPNGYRTIFLISAIPGVLAILVVIFAVRERVSERPADKPALPAFRLRHLGRPFIVFAGLSAIFALGNSSDALLVLRAQDVGTRAALIPLMYFVFNLVGSILATPFGHMSDRFGRRRVIVAGFTGYALVYVGFFFAGAPLAAWLLFAAYGIPYALTEGMTRAYVVDLVGPERRGTAIGGYTFVLGLAALPSSAVAGLMWDHIGHGSPFALSAILMAVAAIGVAVAPSLRAPRPIV